MKILKLNAITILMLLSIAAELSGQAGSLDLTFDNDGIVTTTAGGIIDAGYTVAIQTDGKIVVAGRNHVSMNDDFLLVRYNTDGSLDNTFDSDGIVITDYLGGNETGWSLLIQPDNKIVLTGTHWTPQNNDDIAVIRYNTDGSIDSTFDNDGIVTTDIGDYSDFAWSSALQPDGKIVVAGYDDSLLINRYFVVLRYNTNGSLDATLDNNGIVTTDVGWGMSEIRDVAIQPDGKIVVAGFVYTSSSTMEYAVVRYNSDGSLDNTFSGDGKATTALGTVSQAICLAIQTDSKILVAGTAATGSIGGFGMVRYNTDGTLDNTFDTDGKVITYVGLTTDYCWGIIIQPDGKIVLAGDSHNGWNRIFALARYNTDGSLDNTFDGDGKVTTVIGSSFSIGYSLAIQNDGKLVMAGWSVDTSLAAHVVAVARYNNDLVGMEENTSSEHINIYPNPNNGIFTIDSKITEGEISIYNLMGEIVFSKKLNHETSSEINLSDLPGSIYFVIFNDGTKVYKEKIALQ